MASAPEEGTKSASSATMIDEVYEFSAPQFYDFVTGESDEDRRKAELWFDTALAYAPSPFMPKIKTGRSFTIESLCDFSEADQMTKETADSSLQPQTCNPPEESPQSKIVRAEVKKQEAIPSEPKQEENTIVVCADKEDCKSTKENESVSATTVVPLQDARLELNNCDKENKKSTVKEETCTPVQSIPVSNSKKYQSAKKIATLVRNPLALKPRTQLQSSLSKNTKTPSSKSEITAKNSAATPSFAHENQAIKRQKLEGGKSRQIVSLKPHPLPHKSKSGLMSSNSSFYSSTSIANKTRKEDRKIYVREPEAQQVPFISTAELMNKFQTSTRELSLPQSSSSVKPKLTLTRPKEPEFETAQRVRSVKVKSTAELEEEMMANIPKFKARPVNKKIFESSSLPPIPRSTPHPPEFKEFHFETMARANNNETASIASTQASNQSKHWKTPQLTEPKPPLLHTSLRSRPNQLKSSFELEQAELEKVPKFKARPLNKKIFESKGELGVFCNVKKEVTIPHEFHFATTERLPPPPPPPSMVADLFDKMSLNSESRYEPLPRITTPNPFHLHTEERGAEKERKFVAEVMQKQWEEERAKVPKANPYPYTTDYPVIPPKPDPKHCTKPEPFQLESLVRHEEEMQREMEVRQRREKEEAQLRIFKAKSILKEDPIPVPEKARKPLTQVQEFSLHIDHRASERAEFDQKIKEKEMMYKRYREEMDTERVAEEEKALKQLRRTMVPHARPVPNFNHPFCPQKSFKEITKAKSPNLRVLQRKDRRRMVVNSAVSSAAANMR